MKPQQGLTLLELLMALAIFALAGTAIMKATSEHMRSISMLEQQTFATIIANNRLTELQLETQWPPQNNKKGKEELAGQEWFWRQLVVATEDERMRSVTVEVRESESAESAVISVSAYVGKP